MIERYEDPRIAKTWSDENKVALWQKVELAVIEARSILTIITVAIFAAIRDALNEIPTDIAWWKEREKVLRHDLQAWVEERVRHLAIELRPRFHEDMTSFDTEESAFALMLNESVGHVLEGAEKLVGVLKWLAKKFRYTPMMGVTHGQFAEVQTFGKRCLTWLVQIKLDIDNLKQARENLKYSKLSGAIGNYGGITPEIELEALRILGLKTFYGATQIMPREIYAPLAQALCQLVQTIDKISNDIRLGARSPRPIYQEPFGKNQTGSSRMPQKKNTITTEQNEGMGDMAQGYLLMIMLSIKTWEERAIQQSSVERIAWPDLFHVTMQALNNITRVLEGLQVYPDHMLLDIADTRGTWDAGNAKEFLRERLARFGIDTEGAYRIVQTASFMAFQPPPAAKKIREHPPISLGDLNNLVSNASQFVPVDNRSIEDIIANAELEVVPDLDVTQDQVRVWNLALRQLFASCNFEAAGVFSISTRLHDEARLFQEILGE